MSPNFYIPFGLSGFVCNFRSQDFALLLDMNFKIGDRVRHINGGEEMFVTGFAEIEIDPVDDIFANPDLTINDLHRAMSVQALMPGADPFDTSMVYCLCFDDNTEDVKLFPSDKLRPSD